jgi:hypothetical protein
MRLWEAAGCIVWPQVTSLQLPEDCAVAISTSWSVLFALRRFAVKTIAEADFRTTVKAALAFK